MKHAIFGRFVLVCVLVMAGVAWGEDAPAVGAGVGSVYQPTEADRVRYEMAAEVSRKGEDEKAVEILNGLREAHPNWVAVRIGLALMSLKEDDFSAARDSYQWAVDLDGGNREGLLGVAMMSGRLGEFDKSLEALDRLLKVYPADGQAAILRVQALVQNKRLAEAAKYIAMILSAVKGGDRPAFAAQLGPLQVRAEDYAGAEGTLSEWIAAKPTAEAYVYRADARRGLKKFDEAMADLGEAFKLNQGQPTYPMMYVGSQILFDRGELAAAMMQFVDLLEWVPDNQEVEQAIERAVVARQVQMNADKTGKDSTLVPKVDYEANKEKIAQWNFRKAIGEERIHKALRLIQDAETKGELPGGNVCQGARKLYPAPEVYIAEAQERFRFSMESDEEPLIPVKLTTAWAVRDFRIAAAIMSVRYARHDGGWSVLESEATASLEWADIQENIREGKPSERDEWLIKAHAIELAHDDWGAYQAYKDEKAGRHYFRSPASVMADRIIKNPERLRGVLAVLMHEVDADIAKKDLKAARVCVDHMIKIAYGSADGYIALAKVLNAGGNKEKGAKALAQAVEKDPLNAEAHWRQALELESAKKWQDAMLEYNFAARGLEAPTAGDSVFVELSIASRKKLEFGRDLPALRNIYLAKGDKAYQDKEWPVALVCASRAKFGLGAPSAGALGIAGVAAEALGRHAEAIIDLERAMKLDPKISVYGEWGAALVATGDLNGALGVYDKAISASPDWRYYYTSRGKIKLTQEKYAEAAVDFETAIGKGDENVYTQLDLAECLSVTDVKAAVELYKKIISTPRREIASFGATTMADYARAKLYLVDQGMKTGK